MGGGERWRARTHLVWAQVEMGGGDEREDEPVLVLYKHRQRWVAAAREDRPGIR